MKGTISAIGCAVLMFGIAPFAMADVDSNSIIKDEIEYYLQTDKYIYNLGENVEMLYRVTNLTDESVTLGWVVAEPPAHYKFRVMQGANQIWEYYYGSMFPTIKQFDLGPYESDEFQTTWDMMNDNGTQEQTDDFLISPGIYNVIGELDLIAGGERVPVSVSIDVIPEPSTLLLFGAGLIGLLAHDRRR